MKTINSNKTRVRLGVSALALAVVGGVGYYATSASATRADAPASSNVPRADPSVVALVLGVPVSELSEIPQGKLAIAQNLVAANSSAVPPNLANGVPSVTSDPDPTAPPDVVLVDQVIRGGVASIDGEARDLDERWMSSTADGYRIVAITTTQGSESENPELFVWDLSPKLDEVVGSDVAQIPLPRGTAMPLHITGQDADGTLTVSSSSGTIVVDPVARTATLS